MTGADDDLPALLDELERSGDHEAVEAALRAADEVALDGELDEAAGRRALAAAEIVAAGVGHPADSAAHDRALAWVGEHPQVTPLGPLARRAVDRVATPGSSELRERVFAAGDGRAWTDALDDLRARLVG